MFACMPMLVFGIKTYNFSIIRIIIFSIISLYSGFFAALIWNDITDVDIDKIAHPDRPIPSGRISTKRFFVVALFFSATTFVFSYLISIWCLLLVGASAIFVAIHNKYLKNTVKFPAYSELFTPLQWVIVPVFGYFAIWSSYPSHVSMSINFLFFGQMTFEGSDLINMILFVLFAYFADNAHDLPEGIHDAEGDRKKGVRTYATSFGEKNAAKISFVMFFISGLIGIILFFRTILGFIFFVPFLLIWLYTMYYSYKLLRAEKNDMKDLSSIVGRKGFNYFLGIFDLIFLDIFVQLMFYFSS
jgi:geranylgeranylglycerol-phosphate geranylgeranyltransferase